MNDQILNHPLLSQRYFFPRPGLLPEPFWVDCGDVRLACHYFRRTGHRWTVVFFHGNGEMVNDYLNGFLSWMEQLNCNCLLAEYRGYGESGGRPELGRMLDDVRPLIMAAGVPADQLIFFGRSVGSIFALHGAAVFPQVRGLVLESAIADVLERILLRVDPNELGTTSEDLADVVAKRLDHRAKISSFQGSVLLLHGEQDDLVDPEHARKLYRWANEPKRLRLFPRAGHNDLWHYHPTEYLAEMKKFLEL